MRGKTMQNYDKIKEEFFDTEEAELLKKNHRVYIKKIDILIDPVPEEPNGEGRSPE